MSGDKRRSRRQNFVLDVEVTWEENVVKGYLKDISEHGACCVMPKEIPLLKETKLRILGGAEIIYLSAISIRKQITAQKKEYLFGFDFKSRDNQKLQSMLKAYA